SATADDASARRLAVEKDQRIRTTTGARNRLLRGGSSLGHSPNGAGAPAQRPPPRRFVRERNLIPGPIPDLKSSDRRRERDFWLVHRCNANCHLGHEDWFWLGGWIGVGGASFC